MVTNVLEKLYHKQYNSNTIIKTFQRTGCPKRKQRAPYLHAEGAQFSMNHGGPYIQGIAKTTVRKLGPGAL